VLTPILHDTPAEIAQAVDLARLAARARITGVELPAAADLRVH
jgi:hypothetical protein